MGSRSSTSSIFGHHPHRTDCILTVSQLIRSPTFNRAIQKAYRKINKIPDHEPKNGLGRTFIGSIGTWKAY
jgi:hypothetical protein